MCIEAQSAMNYRRLPAMEKIGKGKIVIKDNMLDLRSLGASDIVIHLVQELIFLHAPQGS